MELERFEIKFFFAIQVLNKIELFQGKPPEQTFQLVILRSKTIFRIKNRVDSDFIGHNIRAGKYEHHRLTFQTIS